MRTFKTPQILSPTIREMTEDLKIMSDDNIEFSIFQDYVVKHNYGIPSGVVSITKNRIYPGAIPDLGCGFKILKLKNVKKSEINTNSIINKIDAYLSGKNKTELSAATYSITIKDMATYGHEATKSLFKHDRFDKYENNGKFSLSPSHILPETIFGEVKKDDIFSKYQGHFLELLTSYDDDQVVYLFIHTGSFMLAEWFRQHYYPKIAELSIKKNLCSIEDVIDERFYIPSNNALYEMYYNDAKALINFSIAYRDVIEYDLIKILSSELKKNIEVDLISDLSHTNILIDGDEVCHLRGVQRVSKSESKGFVVSGNYGIASMLFKSTVDQYIGHGVQVHVDKFAEILDDIDESDSEFLISDDLIEDKADQDVILKSKMAKINYDYYLSNDCELLDFMMPFYSFKE